jgi:hypothetical protein
MVKINNATAAKDNCFPCRIFINSVTEILATISLKTQLLYVYPLLSVLLTKETLSQKHNHLDDS